MHFPTTPFPNSHSNHSSVKWHNDYQDGTPLEIKMENTQDGSLGAWFKITVSILTKHRDYARKTDQGELY